MQSSTKYQLEEEQRHLTVHKHWKMNRIGGDSYLLVDDENGIDWTIGKIISKDGDQYWTCKCNKTFGVFYSEYDGDFIVLGHLNKFKKHLWQFENLDALKKAMAKFLRGLT